MVPNFSYTRTVDVYRRENVGTIFHPIYAWGFLEEKQCVKNQLSFKKMIRDEGGKVQADYFFFCDYGDVQGTDRIVDGSNVYEVYRVFDPNELHRHLEIFALLLPEGTLENMEFTS